MLHTLYGSAAYDRRGSVNEIIEKNIERGIKTYILVPEQLSVTTERDIYMTYGVSAQLLVEVWTFSRLSNEILSELGPLRLNYIDGAGKEIIARKTLLNIENELKYFKSNVKQKGFSSTMLTLISEFKRYGLDNEKLDEVREKINHDELKNKLSDIGVFYREYAKLVEEKGMDAEDNLAIAKEKIKDFSVPNNSELIVCEFKSFTPLEYEVLGELMKKVRHMHAVLLCDDLYYPSDAFKSAANTYRSLNELSEEIGIGAEKPQKIKQRQNVSDEFLYLWDNFYKTNPKKYKKEPNHIHMVSPKSYYDEAKAAAAIIHNLIRTKGYRQNDFLVLARDIEKYDRIIPLIFEEYGLNVFINSDRSLMSNPFSRSVMALLEILSYGFSYDRVSLIMKSGLITGFSRHEGDIFDNYCLAAGPSHAMWNDEKPWKYNPDLRKFDMDVINKVKTCVLSPIYELKSKIHGRKSVSEITAAVFEYIKSCSYEEAFKKKCAAYSKKGMVYLAEEYRMAWNGVVSVFERMNDIMGDENITYSDFYDIFISACLGTKIGISPQTLDEVTFANIDMFRTSSAKVVFVLGVNYGVLPKGYSAEGVLSDSEREIMRDYGISLAMTASEKSDDEQSIIYSVLSAASDELYLMSPYADNVGNPLDKSSIIKKIEGEIFDIHVLGVDDLSLEFEGKNSIIGEIKTFCAKNDISSIDEIPDEVRTLYDIVLSDENKISNVMSYLERLRAFKSGYEMLSPDAVEKLYGKDIMLSASKLEKFNSCAFAYFMKYGLFLKERDMAEFDSISLGNILHAALEEYFSAKKAQNADYNEITRDMCESEMGEIVGRLSEGSDEVMYKASAYYKYLVSRIHGIATTTAWETIKFYQNSLFRPYGFEIKIGDTVPPLLIKTKSGTAGIEGFIDRADSAEIDGKTYISIVDYKSSVRDLDVNLALSGVHFQPLVYANAMKSGLNVIPAAMLYQQMNDPIIDENKAETNQKYETELRTHVKLSGWVENDIYPEFDKTNQRNKGGKVCISKEEMEKRLNAATEKISQTTEEIFGGVINANPYKKFGFDPCEYCEYKSICMTK